MEISIRISGYSIDNIHARIGTINLIHQGYVMFHIRNCDYDMRFIALPLDWVCLGPIDSFRFRRQIQASQTDFIPPLEGILSESTTTITDTRSESHVQEISTTQRVIQHVASMGTITTMGYSVAGPYGL
jgi:hypothetical protein